MPTLVSCFNTASENIEPIEGDYTNAMAAHESVRKCLGDDLALKSMEIDTTLIGSYKRRTAIRRVKDVDVFAKLPSFDVTVNSDALSDLVRSALIKNFGNKAVEPQDRSTLVSFGSFDLTVDVVPAKPLGQRWEIPNGTEGWMETNPEAMSDLATATNTRYHDLYIPVVKLIRQTRRNLLGTARPGGYLFEVLTYHAFDCGLDGSDRGTLYVNALNQIALSLTSRSHGIAIVDPTMPWQSIDVNATDEEWSNAAVVFTEAASQASGALISTDDCAAAKTFRDLLGKNSADNWVFPMPALCNEDGTKEYLTVTLPGSAQVAAGRGRFA